MADFRPARRQRGSAKSSITKVEENIIRLETKERLTGKNQFVIQHHLQTLDFWDGQFRTEQAKAVALSEEDQLKREQAELGSHSERLSEFIDCLKHALSN